MKIEFKIKRRRQSVTQGEAIVYLNGHEVITFNDDIRLIKGNTPFYGENIKGYASVKSDDDFIKATLFHPYDGLFHIRDRVKEILFRE